MFYEDLAELWSKNTDDNLEGRMPVTRHTKVKLLIYLGHSSEAQGRMYDTAVQANSAKRQALIKQLMYLGAEVEDPMGTNFTNFAYRNRVKLLLDLDLDLGLEDKLPLEGYFTERHLLLTQLLEIGAHVEVQDKVQDELGDTLRSGRGHLRRMARSLLDRWVKDRGFSMGGSQVLLGDTHQNEPDTVSDEYSFGSFILEHE